MFDLAYGYPLSEVSFAKAMSSQSAVTREEVFVVTKLHPRYLGYDETLRAIDMSLSNLNVTYIDLFLIHSTECDDFLLTCEEGLSLYTIPHYLYYLRFRKLVLIIDTI